MRRSKLFSHFETLLKVILLPVFLLIAFVISDEAGAQTAQRPQQSPATDAAAIARWQKVQNFYFMLTGVELSKHNTNYDKLLNLSRQLTDQDNSTPAASAIWNQITELIINDFYFNRVTMADFAARMSNLDGSVNQTVGGLQLMILETIRLNADFRNVLTLPYSILDYNRNLVPETAQRGEYDVKFGDVKSLTSFSGLISTSEFAEKFLSGGTNRRPIKYLFHTFLCSPISSIKDYSIPDTFVGVDITRIPGQDASKYQSDCRGCHSWMDGMRGAFSKVDYGKERKIFGVGENVFQKMNNHPETAPNGYKVIDDSWAIHPDWADRVQLGIKNLNGTGYRSLGVSLATSDGFDTCVPRQVIKSVCQTMPTIDEIKANNLKLSDHKYKMKDLMKAAILSPLCQKNINTGQKIKSFRGVLYSLLNASDYGRDAAANAGNKIAINPAAVSSFPQLGLMTEVGVAGIATLVKLSATDPGLCRRIATSPNLSYKTKPEAIEKMILLKETLLGRSLNNAEIENVNDFANQYANGSAMEKFCTFGLLGNPDFLFNPYGGAQ